MAKSRTSYRSQRITPQNAWNEARRRCEAGEASFTVARSLNIPPATLRFRCSRDRWTTPIAVRKAAEALAQFQTSLGVPVWEDGKAFGAAVRTSLEQSRFTILPVPDSWADALLKGTLDKQALYQKLKPQFDAAHQVATQPPKSIATDNQKPSPPDCYPELAETENPTITISFNHQPAQSLPLFDQPEPHPQPKSETIVPATPNPRQIEGRRELTTRPGEIEPWEAARVELRAALDAELHRVATFLPVCKTMTDVKTALAVHRDLHGKLEQASGPNSVIINLGMLRDCSREKLAKGKVAGT